MAVAITQTGSNVDFLFWSTSSPHGLAVDDRVSFTDVPGIDPAKVYTVTHVFDWSEPNGFLTNRFNVETAHYAYGQVAKILVGISKTHAIIGGLFDTEKKYVFRTSDQSTAIKMPNLWTITGTYDALRYEFDGALYLIIGVMAGGPDAPPNVAPMPRIWYLTVL
jgi:hypothetical protein